MIKIDLVEVEDRRDRTLNLLQRCKQFISCTPRCFSDQNLKCYCGADSLKKEITTVLDRWNGNPEWNGIIPQKGI